MTKAAYKRHDISDGIWMKIKKHLLGRASTVGKPAKDNRKFTNGVLWVLRTGAPWRDFPEYYGSWNNVQRRFCRWQDRGV